MGGTVSGDHEGGDVPSEYALKLSEAELARYQIMAETAARIESGMWDACGICEGAVVADVGCGPGAISAVLARLVAPTGRVVAVDGDAGVVEAARASAARAGLDNVSVEVGRADDTGIPPASVDVVVIRHVLAHNGGREEAIVAHAASLVRPGGHVYLVDTDLTAFRVRPYDPDIEDLDARYREWHKRQGNDMSIGLRLSELLQAAGLEVVDFQGRYNIIPAPAGFRPPSWASIDKLLAAGLATPEDVERWSTAFEGADKWEKRPVVFAPLFFATGRRPQL